MTPEPAVSSEAGLQAAVLSALRLRLESRDPGKIRHSLLERFGLDLAILMQSPVETAFRFIEFKAYAGQRPGGIGFGDQKGRGPQVDLLMLPDALLVSLASTVTWCFADLTIPKGQRRYSAISCAEAKHAAMGKIGHGKQNNFRIRDALARPLTWDELISALENFLLGHS